MKETYTLRRKQDRLPGRFAYSTFSKDLDLPERRSLGEVAAMTPEEMARASRLVTSAYNELLAVAASLEDRGYRRLMTECVAAPRVEFDDQAHEGLVDEVLGCLTVAAGTQREREQLALVRVVDGAHDLGTLRPRRDGRRRQDLVVNHGERHHVHNA